MSRKDELLKVWKNHENIGYIPCLYADYNFLRHPALVNERPEGKDGEDWFGVKWVYDPLTNAPVVDVSFPPLISDVSDWKETLKLPDLQAPDWETAAKEETAGWDRENKVCFVMLINGIFERAHHLLGFEGALTAPYDDPEAYHELLECLADYKCELVNIICKYYKPDILMMHDDYGANDRMMLSPETWREFIKKPLSRIVKTAHDNGVIYEHHSCGYIEPIIGDLIEIGVDSLDPLQTPCNDIEAVKKQYGGKITLVGGFNSQGVQENPQATYEEKLADIEHAYNILAPGGGYCSMPVVIDMKAIAKPIMEVHKKMATAFAE